MIDFLKGDLEVPLTNGLSGSFQMKHVSFWGKCVDDRYSIHGTNGIFTFMKRLFLLCKHVHTNLTSCGILMI